MGVGGGQIAGMEGPDLSMVMERRKARSLRTPRRCGAMIANKVFGGVGGTGGWQSHRASETRALTAAAAHEGGEPQAAADRGIMTPRCWDGGGAGSGSRQEVQLSCKCPSCDRPQAMRTIKLLAAAARVRRCRKRQLSESGKACTRAFGDPTLAADPRDGQHAGSHATASIYAPRGPAGRDEPEGGVGHGT